MKLEYDFVRMQLIIAIDWDELNRAFMSQVNYQALIAKISQTIYKSEKGRRL